MPDPITMDGQYAYACDPYTQVRILCVDAPKTWPVRSMDADGQVNSHLADGSALRDDGHDLIPLQVRHKPVEAWALVGPNNWVVATYDSEASARGSSYYGNPGARLVRLVEAEDGK